MGCKPAREAAAQAVVAPVERTRRDGRSTPPWKIASEGGSSSLAPTGSEDSVMSSISFEVPELRAASWEGERVVPRMEITSAEALTAAIFELQSRSTSRKKKGTEELKQSIVESFLRQEKVRRRNHREYMLKSREDIHGQRTLKRQKSVGEEKESNPGNSVSQDKKDVDLVLGDRVRMKDRHVFGTVSQMDGDKFCQVDVEGTKNKIRLLKKDVYVLERRNRISRISTSLPDI